VSWLVFAGIVLTFLTSVVGFLQSRQNKAKIKVVDTKVEGVHVLVNSQHDDLVDRVTQLTETLERADVEVPDPPA
jgi:hypothetical protein